MDNNLKLNILERSDFSRIETFNRKSFLKELGWTIEKIDDFEDPVEEIRNHFLEMEILRPENIEWLDEGNNLFKYKIALGFDGETDYFNIHSLEGIAELCPNLKKVTFGNLSVTDLTPLTQLSLLEEAQLDCFTLVSPEPLLNLPKIKKLGVFAYHGGNESRWKEIEQTLKALGVKVSFSLVSEM